MSAWMKRLWLDWRGETAASTRGLRGSCKVEDTFCWRQSLHARFTPGWCRWPFVVVGLPLLSTSPLGVEMELRFRLRCVSSSPGVVVPVGLVCCGERIAGAVGSKAVPECQLMVALVFSLIRDRASRRCNDIGDGGRRDLDTSIF